VWGDPTSMEPILINGKKYNITKNLYDALNSLPDIDKSSVWWWIDAICIDQQDNTEKSMQVPRMTHIYSSAYRVLAWLGAEVPEYFDLFLHVGRKIPTDLASVFRIQEELGESFIPFLVGSLSLSSSWIRTLNFNIVVQFSSDKQMLFNKL
jgi:hypothetical protein